MRKAVWEEGLATVVKEDETLKQDLRVMNRTLESLSALFYIRCSLPVSPIRCFPQSLPSTHAPKMVGSQ